MHNKQNVFDDFIACAEHLVQKGYTSPAKLVTQVCAIDPLYQGPWHLSSCTLAALFWQQQIHMLHDCSIEALHTWGCAPGWSLHLCVGVRQSTITDTAISCAGWQQRRPACGCLRQSGIDLLARSCHASCSITCSGMFLCTALCVTCTCAAPKETVVKHISADKDEQVASESLQLVLALGQLTG